MMKPQWLLAMVFVLIGSAIQAQVPDAFRVPTFRKVDNKDRAAFMTRFNQMRDMTGNGFQGETAIDRIPSTEIRARLQRQFGNPTVTVADFVGAQNVRPGNSIQFEYWFIVNDSIPMMILDSDGPFANGLVIGGSSRYVDRMPEVKRAFSDKLMSDRTLAEFNDYFYSPERELWYQIRYSNGKFETKTISVPDHLKTLRFR
jgi:hypothetical protein